MFFTTPVTVHASHICSGEKGTAPRVRASLCWGYEDVHLTIWIYMYQYDIMYVYIAHYMYLLHNIYIYHISIYVYIIIYTYIHIHTNSIYIYIDTWYTLHIFIALTWPHHGWTILVPPKWVRKLNMVVIVIMLMVRQGIFLDPPVTVLHCDLRPLGSMPHRFRFLDSGRSKRFCKFKSMLGYLVLIRCWAVLCSAEWMSASPKASKSGGCLDCSVAISERFVWLKMA